MGHRNKEMIGYDGFRKVGREVFGAFQIHKFFPGAFQDNDNYISIGGKVESESLGEMFGLRVLLQFQIVDARKGGRWFREVL